MVYACDRPRSEQSGFKPWSRKLSCELGTGHYLLGGEGHYIWGEGHYFLSSTLGRAIFKKIH